MSFVQHHYSVWITPAGEICVLQDRPPGHEMFTKNRLPIEDLGIVASYVPAIQNGYRVNVMYGITEEQYTNILRAALL